MKPFKIALFALLLVACVASCEKPEKDAERLAGTYYGVFTNRWYGQNDKFVKEDAPVEFQQNSSDPASLMLANAVSLERADKYRYQSDVTDSAVVSALINVCAETDSTFCGDRIAHFRSQVNRVKIDAHFGSSDLALKIVFCAGVENRASTEFTGTKY